MSIVATISKKLLTTLLSKIILNFFVNIPCVVVNGVGDTEVIVVFPGMVVLVEMSEVVVIVEVWVVVEVVVFCINVVVVVKGIVVVAEVLIGFSVVDVAMLGDDVEGKDDVVDDCSVLVLDVVELVLVTVS